MSDCGLCSAHNEDYRVVFKNQEAVSLVIANPFNDGHLMILPRRHVITLDNLTAEESKALHEILSESQQRLLEVFPDYPPVLGMQVGRHSTQPHIHYQMFPSDAHLRLLYGAAHPTGSLEAITVPRTITHPEYTTEKLEEIARRLRS